MDPIFDNDNTLTADQEAIVLLSRGDMTEDIRQKIKTKSISTFSTDDLMELGTLGLLIEENSLLSTSTKKYSSYLVPDESTDKNSGLYRIVVEDGETGIEVMCPLNQTVRIFKYEDEISLQQVKELSSDSSYIGKLKLAMALESVWIKIGSEGNTEKMKTLSETMEYLFGIPAVSGSDFNNIMDSLEGYTTGGDTLPSIEYFTALKYCEKVKELLDSSSISLNDAKAILEFIIEKFVLPTEVAAGVLRDLYRDEKYTSIVEEAVANKSGDYYSR